jgi:hypothetical protein
MKKSAIYRAIATALAVGLGCVPVATSAFAASPDRGGSILVSEHSGHGGGFAAGQFDGARFGGGHFGGRHFAGGWGWGFVGAPYRAYDYGYGGRCWQPKRVHTRKGWHWREVWVCP